MVVKARRVWVSILFGLFSNFCSFCRKKRSGEKIESSYRILLKLHNNARARSTYIFPRLSGFNFIIVIFLGVVKTLLSRRAASSFIFFSDENEVIGSLRFRGEIYSNSIFAQEYLKLEKVRPFCIGGREKNKVGKNRKLSSRLRTKKTLKK